MATVTSEADKDLAHRATEAGWPTTPSQVQELRKRKALPPTFFIQRGRGVTKTAYPPEALDVLIALRRASADFRQHHRAVVLAWVRGADVRTEGLRSELRRHLEEIHRQTVKEARRNAEGKRTHRRKESKPMIADVGDRSFALEVAADMMSGRFISAPRAEYFAELLATVLTAVFSEVEPSDSALVSSSDVGKALTEAITAPLTGEAPVLLGGDPANYPEIDLQMNALGTLVRSCPREDLDHCREVFVRLFADSDFISSPADELGLALGIVGMAGSVSVFEGLVANTSVPTLLRELDGTTTSKTLGRGSRRDSH